MNRTRAVSTTMACCAFGLAALVACSSFGDATPEAPGADGSIPDPLPESGAVDGPPGDAGSLDAACPAFATFCDDFEIGDLRRWGELNVTPPSSLAVDEAGPPHRGGRGLHFTTKMSDDGSSASIRSKPFPAVTQGTIATRFYIMGPTVPSTGTTFVWLTKGTSDEAEAILYSSYGKWGAESVAGSLGPGTVVTSNVAFEPGKWLCIEWVVDVGTKGRQQLFIDGNNVPVLTQEMNTIGDVSQGFRHGAIYMNNQGAATQELFFDDVAIAVLPTRAEGARIGCIP